MEFNKDEARRALDIAERKLSMNDFYEAKKLVNKAQKLYPKLGGLEQMLIMIDVYISSSNKTNGGRVEADWYGVLGVDPLADDETVKKRYKKLALLLHPDKNRFKGAEGAFKLVLEAWYLLSDKAKRIAYDQKRKSNQNRQKEPASYYRPPQKYTPREPDDKPSSYYRPRHPPPPPPTPTPKTEPKVKPKPTPEPDPDPDPDPPMPMPKPKPKPKPKLDTSSTVKVGTFWTVCNECKTYCEFMRASYLNRTVSCSNCGQYFVATVIPPEIINGRLVIRLSPCHQSTWKSTSDTSESHDNAKAKAAPERMKRWFDPMPAPKPELDSSTKKEIKFSTFWTVCNRCKTHCKLVKADSLNKTMPCPNCSQEFVAAEILPEIINGGPVIILCPSVQSTSKRTGYASSKTSATDKAKTAYQREEILKRLFPESREKIAADVAAAATGGNAKEAERLYKKMTTGNANSEPMATGNSGSTHEAERLFKKPMTV